MKFSFGTGKLIATPRVGEPAVFGTVQDVSIDISYSDKELRGEDQFPVDIARVTGKVGIKAKFATIDGKLFNNIFFGANAITSGERVKITLNNQPMGATPEFALSFETNYKGAKRTMLFPRVISQKLNLSFKNEDYTIPDLEMSAFADESGKVMEMEL